MIRRSRQAPTVTIRADVRARFLEALKRVERREAEVTTDVRRALARAGRRKPKGASGWRKTRHQAVKLFASRRRATA